MNKQQRKLHRQLRKEIEAQLRQYADEARKPKRHKLSSAINRCNIEQ